MYKKSLFKIVAILLTIMSFVSCDKDFNEIGTDIIDDDHYLFDKAVFDVTAESLETGVVQSNNLTLNPLGIYQDDIYGKTTASFVTQIALDAENPTIGDNPTIKNVVLTIPYFSNLESTDENGDHVYTLDSVFNPNGTFDLQVYRSGFFLGDQELVDGVLTPKVYYNDLDETGAVYNARIGEKLNISTDSLEQNSAFFFNKKEHKRTETVDGTETTTRTAPGMRLKLDPEVFNAAILHAPEGKLSNNNIFKEYFRGLLFKVGGSNNDGTMGMLNFAEGEITINYTIPPASGSTSSTPIKKTVVLNLTGNTVSLLKREGNPTTVPADRLYAKGGQGFVTRINQLITAEQLATIKAKKWMINEASLTFYVDQETLDGNIKPENEPNRLYLYDLEHKQPILDYFLDNTTTFDSKKNKYVFGGNIERDAPDPLIEGSVGKGKRYKIRVTDYLRSLINDDSTNVALGLSVTESIATSSMAKRKDFNDPDNLALGNYVPTASIMNPLGTVLFGGSQNVAEDKRLKLVIYYTEPEE